MISASLLAFAKRNQHDNQRPDDYGTRNSYKSRELFSHYAEEKLVELTRVNQLVTQEIPLGHSNTLIENSSIGRLTFWAQINIFCDQTRVHWSHLQRSTSSDKWRRGTSFSGD